jgi:hypothetical protein|nr:MAG TPA: hypothetical protein [Caudoviricetes sp.]
MTIQEKVLYIIKLLELSDRQVATATGKALSTINHKRLQLGRNKFTDEDLQKLKVFYIEKLKEIQSLT